MHQPQAHQDPHKACSFLNTHAPLPGPALFHACNRRDKYEKDKIEYWVEEETKGSYELLQSEAWSDKRQIDVAEDDGPDQGTDNESDDADDDSGETSISSDSASTSGAKKKKRGKSSKAKKSKKEKKTNKSKSAKKKKKNNRSKSSPSSKSGSPKKAQLEEEARAEATDRNSTIPNHLEDLASAGDRERRRSHGPAPSCPDEGGGLRGQA